MTPALLPTLLIWAVLLPLISFWVILFTANKLGKAASVVAVSAIGGSAILSFISLFIWLNNHWPPAPVHHHDDAHHGEGDHHSAVPTPRATFVSFKLEEAKKADDHAADAAHADHGHNDAHAANPHYTGTFYTLGQFGKLQLTISYYIDSLTITMFCMVTFIATLIHCYAMGYMHDELHDITDHEVTLSNGKHLHRPGRFPRFFQYLSLFCFSMLGLVIAGNVAMVFVFWELVGICSYFLIGFYVERKSASTAANKAFIVNRVGDFGMLIGLMALWSSVGTFAFGDIDANSDHVIQAEEQGLFTIVRPGPKHELIVPDAMVVADATNEVAKVALEQPPTPEGRKAAAEEIAFRTSAWRSEGYGYWMLVVAGVGIFCGCVGKSAQFPLHVWLPDAMEGPTPVSALVHSATMVAAGVYLVGRFFPVFAPEALLVIALVGCITLFLAAAIAITAVDIKRVLAYSTISQLGYMMLSLGVGGWKAGLMHLVTHAFFKSLLFMCSGSVIHAVHTNDMRKMGGLFKKMPVTAITMLIGCLAIAGVGVPFVIGFSGYYSKDMILEQAYSFAGTNRSWSGLFFLATAGGASITAFYMFRMWFMTFVGKPRDAHAYDHAHESPPIMFMPLVILSVLAVTVAWDINMIGYGVVPVAFLAYLAAQNNWLSIFAGGGGHGHDDHGHGHDDHGHSGHDSHGDVHHAHDDHGHGHDHSHHGAGPTMPHISVATLAVLLVASLIVGGIGQAILPNSNLSLSNLLGQAEPAGIAADATGKWINWTWPAEWRSHDPAIVRAVTLIATGTWVMGISLAALLYAVGVLSPADVRKSFEPIYQLLWNKWWFDELYNFLFVRPSLVIGRMIADFDRNWIDGFINGLATWCVAFSRWWDAVADRGLIDGSANLFGSWTYSLGLSLRTVQTGRLRQYVLFIVIGALALFALVTVFWTPTLAR